MLETVLFQTIQFSMIILFSSIWPIDRTLSGATTPGQSGPGSNGNEEVLRISQNSNITVTSALYCLVSYQDIRWRRHLTPLQRRSQCILQPQPTEQGDWRIKKLFEFFGKIEILQIKNSLSISLLLFKISFLIDLSFVLQI